MKITQKERIRSETERNAKEQKKKGRGNKTERKKITWKENVKRRRGRD